ncbi:MAG: nicotinamide mononucleotide transporter [Bacteroidaceae bacterium]|nr:nicotinamide mononucleotide transporter [Bacteroidaceae bacterium]
MQEFLTAHWLDMTTTVLGLLYIWFEYRASLWMWLVGFLMQALGIVLYYQKGLYADCGMEFYYLSMTIYGGWNWSRGIIENKELPIKHFPKRFILPWVFIFCAVWALIYWLLLNYTNSNVPLADSFTTALSIIGIWALVHKYLEQWFIWIVVDVVTSVLYFYKDIPFKASLYALYVIIAIMGYFKWRRMMKKEG